MRVVPPQFFWAFHFPCKCGEIAVHFDSLSYESAGRTLSNDEIADRIRDRDLAGVEIVMPCATCGDVRRWSAAMSPEE
jgi:hypothetical protein